MEQKDTVLIVDDLKANRELLKSVLEEDFRLLFAENGLEALAFFREARCNISAVLLDLIMPMLDGVEVVRQLNRLDYTSRIPIFITSAASKKDYIDEAFSYGAYDWIPEPICGRWMNIRIRRAIDYFHCKQRCRTFTESQRSEESRNVRRRQAQTEMAQTVLSDLSRTLCSVVETGDCRARHHIRNVCRITSGLMQLISRKYPEHGLNAEDVFLISCAAAVHDIGKISLSPDLRKREDGGGIEALRLHTEAGWKILSEIPDAENRKFFRYGREICRWHHERWNGKGYPDGLYRQETPIWAQVVGFADVYDCLAGESAGGAAPEKEILNRIRSGEQGVFNPTILSCFSELSCGEE